MHASNDKSSKDPAIPGSFASTGSTPIPEAQIRKIMADHARAVRAKDINQSMSHYAPSILLFDVANPTQDIGLDACRKRTEEWFSSFLGPIRYDNHDPSITTADDVAFCHSLNQVIGTRTDGARVERWWRATVCFRKVDGKWLIEHEHASMPIDGRATRQRMISSREVGS